MSMSKNILVTGGCGFIGSHFVRFLLNERDNYRVLNLDNLSYAGDIRRLKDIETDKRYDFIEGDIRKIKDIRQAFRDKIDVIVHFAAETHVDRSIQNPYVFEEVNTRGTLNLLEIAREYKVKRFIFISTDEIYGEIREGRFTENSPLSPNSPYSVSKAAADLMVSAYVRTYSLPAIIVRPSNNYGPWQYPEKFIPVAICSILSNKKIPVYAKGLNRREWLYVEDCVRAIVLIAEEGKIGEIYNLGSGRERRNIDVAKDILKIMEKPYTMIKFVQDRPGHDFRYALDSSKIERLGWRPRVDFKTGIINTVIWYKTNLKWVKKKFSQLD